MKSAGYIVAWLGIALGWSTSAPATDPITVEYLWQSQPTLDFDWRGPPVVPNIDVKPQLIEAHSVRDRMRAAQNLLRAPNSASLDRPAVLKALISRLQAGESHRTVRTEMIAAACELDDGTSAELLWKLARGDADAEVVVQRACVTWRSALPLDKWRQCVNSTTSTEQELLLALEGVGATGADADVPQLKSIVLDGTRAPAIRLASARAIGSVATSDQLSLAQELKVSSVEFADLLSIEVLRKSPVANASAFVQAIAVHGSQPAQRAAYRWLCEREANTAQQMVEPFLKHADSAVRLLALQQITLANNDKTLPALFDAFHDLSPGVRDAARVHVLTCADRGAEHAQLALSLLKNALEESDWRALEQAIRLAVELKQNSYCDRLMSLIHHESAEVCITAGWALRNLAEEEAILARMLEHVNELTDKLLNKPGNDITEMHLRCAAHLLEAFGHRKYEPAKTTVVQYVPKVFRLGLITRMAAIWSCGRLWENAENKQLIKQLHERIADKNSMFPESLSVRFIATLALGYIGDAESRGPLVTWDEPKPTPIGYATEWSLKRIDHNPTR